MQGQTDIGVVLPWHSVSMVLIKPSCLGLVKLAILILPRLNFFSVAFFMWEILG